MSFNLKELDNVTQSYEKYFLLVTQCGTGEGVVIMRIIYRNFGFWFFLLINNPWSPSLLVAVTSCYQYISLVA